jgi:phospholipid/cholesterol/gamma-HCH transport system permease protein
MNLIQDIGKSTLTASERTGALLFFSLKAVIGALKPPYDIKSIFSQFKIIGFYSLPVVGMTALFSGAVLALQSYTGFSRFMAAESSVATVVVLSITRELGPVMAGLMVAGRVGAAIAAEIGTMKVTEQIDALYTLSTEPIKYLVSPRLLACLIMLPCLVIVADVIGVFGGYLVCVYKLGFNKMYYVKNTFKYLEMIDVISGLVKSAVFGVIIALIGCYNGYKSDKGAQGVGAATTAAVVNSSALILLANYIITECFFSK